MDEKFDFSNQLYATSAVIISGMVFICLGCRASKQLIAECRKSNVHPWVAINDAFIVMVIPFVATIMLLIANNAISTVNVTQRKLAKSNSTQVITYICLFLGGTGIGHFIKDVFRGIFGQYGGYALLRLWENNAPERKQFLITMTYFAVDSFFSFLIGLAIADTYLPLTKDESVGNWMYMDIVSFGAIYLCTGYCLITSFNAALSLLSAMCAWDAIFAFLNTTKKVITELHAPIFVRFPRVPFYQITDWTGFTKEFTSLAALDFIVLGMFISTIYRFGHEKKTCAYTITNIIGLGLGLCLTYTISFYRQQPTPAMIIPGFIITMGSLIVAWSRRELDQLWHYQDLL